MAQKHSPVSLFQDAYRESQPVRVVGVGGRIVVHPVIPVANKEVKDNLRRRHALYTRAGRRYKIIIQRGVETRQAGSGNIQLSPASWMATLGSTRQYLAGIRL